MVMTLNMPIISPVGTINRSSGQFSPSDMGTFSFRTAIIPEGTPVPGSANLTLKHALLVQVEISRDGFVIRSGDVDEEAYGSTYGEAYLDFLTSLRDRCNSLSHREQRLSAQDRTVLAKLRALLQ